MIDSNICKSIIVLVVLLNSSMKDYCRYYYILEKLTIHKQNSLFDKSYDNLLRRYYNEFQSYNNTIYYLPPGHAGLCNVLRSCRGILALSMHTKARLQIIRNDIFNVLSRRLAFLKTNFERLILERCTVLYDICSISISDIKLILLKSCIVVRGVCDYSQVLKEKDINQYLRSWLPHHFSKTQVQSLLTRLLFIPRWDIYQSITNYSYNIKMNNIELCIQLRTGGNLSNSNEKHVFMDISKLNTSLYYVNKEYPKISSIYISSDSDYALNMSKSILKNFSIYHMNKYKRGHSSGHHSGGDRDGNLEGAIFELGVLSKCKRIIYTPYSSYGKMAAILANISANTF